MSLLVSHLTLLATVQAAPANGMCILSLVLADGILWESCAHVCFVGNRYTQRTVIVGPKTNCDPKLRTMGVSCNEKRPDWPCKCDYDVCFKLIYIYVHSGGVDCVLCA